MNRCSIAWWPCSKQNGRCTVKNTCFSPFASLWRVLCSVLRVQHCCFVHACVYFCCRHFYKSYLFDYFCRQITTWFKLYFSISVDLRHHFICPRIYGYVHPRRRAVRRKTLFLETSVQLCVYESIYVLLLSTHGFDYYLSWSCILFEGRKHWGFYYVHGKHLRLSPVRWRGISPPLTDTQKLEYNTFWKAY